MNIIIPKRLKEKMAKLVKTTKKMPRDNFSEILKILIVYKIQVEFESLYNFGKPKNDPVPMMKKTLGHFIKLSENMSKFSFHNDIHCFNIVDSKTVQDTLLDRVHSLYGNLFYDFDDELYFEEAYKLLEERFKKNKVNVEWFKGKTCLDDGCGGGRYTMALARYGFKKVVGLDASAKSISDARNRSKKSSLAGKVQFKKGDALDLPFKDKKFDFVFSNGVLHHTYDTRKGLREIYRVLKDKGRCWMYLYGNYGLEWWGIEELFKIIKHLPQSLVQSTLAVLGLPPNKIFYFMDRFSPAIKNHYTLYEMEKMLEKSGFKIVSKLDRGVKDDLIEYLYNGNKYAKKIYGYGDLRYILEKNEC